MPTTYTHTGDIVGADSRTRPGYRRTVCLIEMKRYYKDEKGGKWSKGGWGYPVPFEKHPLYKLVNIQPVLR